MITSPETKITFEFGGSGAEPSSMGTTTPSSSPTSSDTGLFTSSDSLSASSIVAGLLLCFLITATVIIFKTIKQPHMQKLSFSNSFSLRSTKSVFKKLGIFVFLLLVSGAILPNLLADSESASALIPENATTVELSTGSNGSLTGGATISGANGKFAYVKETLTCSSACSIYLSTATSNNNMNYGGDTSKGWISAKSGAKSALTVNTWGYAISAPETPSATSAIWSVVPAKGNESKIIDNQTGDIEVTYGAYANNTIPAGNYFNTVVYTAVKPF